MNPALQAAIWGFCGAVPYAGTRLVTAFWGSADVDARQRKLAVGHFLIAMFFGPVAAAAAAPWLTEHAKSANLASVAVAIGLLINVLWPMLTRRGVLRPVLAKLLGQLGGWLGELGKAVGATSDDG